MNLIDFINPTIIAITYFLLINVITFFMYGIDKQKAKHNKWRIPEATLIAPTFIGGAIGAMIGMKVWHHKTQKTKFKICVPIGLVFTVAEIVFAIYLLFMVK